MLTRQAMRVWRNIEASLCNQFGSGKAITITYSEYVFVDLGIEHTTHMRHIVSCDLPGYAIFLYIIS
jgi:hypothetical protein